MPDENGVVASTYKIDPARPVLTLSGGLRAFTVIDRRDTGQALMAVETRQDLPARPRITLARAGTPVPFAALPLDYGTGRDLAGQAGWFIVCDALPGPKLSLAQGAWREQELIACVLQPAAMALCGLLARGLTHRSIHPENLFREGPHLPVTLGPFWAAPPGSLQPAVYEPPYMARCLATGRGDGMIADDVYALGVTLLALATGRVPLAGMDEAQVIRRKIELGSYTALTENVALPPLIADLLRSMLAEDPDHRPSPELLLRPEQARSRRVAARPPRRAQLPLNLKGRDIWSARDLAHEMGLWPERAHMLLKSGAVERWLRRSLGDTQLAMVVEDLTRQPGLPEAAEAAEQADLVVMKAVSCIDRLAPLVWRGIAVQPDGVGSALVGATPEITAALQEIVAAEAVAPYLATHERRQELAGPREEAREWHLWLEARGPAGGLRRLTYQMNPMLVCLSPLLAGHIVMRMSDVLPALEAASATADRSRPPIDGHIAAFIAARADGPLTGDLISISSFAGPSERLQVLRLFGRLETRMQPGPLPGLAGWLLQSGFATLEDWRSHKRRAELQDALTKAANAGRIGAMLMLVDDAAAKDADEAGAEAAIARVRELEAALKAIEIDAPQRSMAAQQLGYEVATALGLLATLGAVIGLAWP